MTVHELPKSLHEDIKRLITREMASAFPEPPPAAPAFMGNVQVADLKVIGFAPEQHRKINENLSVLQGYVLYGTDNHTPEYMLGAKIALSLQEGTLTALPEDDRFLEEDVGHSTSHLLRYYPDSGYRTCGTIQAINASTIRKVTPPFPRSGVHARLYTAPALEPVAKAYTRNTKFLFNESSSLTPENAASAALTPSPAPPPAEAENPVTVSTTPHDASIQSSDATAILHSLGLHEIEAPTWMNAGRETPLPLTSSTVLHRVTYGGGSHRVMIAANYGIRTDKNEPVHLLRAVYEIETGSSQEALATRPAKASYQQRKTSPSYIKELGLDPIPLTAITDALPYHNAYVRIYRSDISRTTNLVPKLGLSNPYIYYPADALKNAVIDHFNLNRKYTSQHVTLGDIRMGHSLSLLSGGRSGSLVAHMKAWLSPATINEMKRTGLKQDYAFDPDFSEILGGGISFVLRVASTPRQCEMLKHHVFVQNALYKEGLPVPKTDESRIIPYYYDDTGQIICLEEYKSGNHSDRMDHRHLAAFGEAMGKLHGSGLEFPEPPARNVLDEEVILGDVRWALNCINNLIHQENDTDSPLPSRKEMLSSLKKELLNRFAVNDKRQPAWIYLNSVAPDLALTLDIDEDAQEQHEAAQAKAAEPFNHLPEASACWNDVHLGNLILHHDGKITMLDFSNSGKGVPARDLELAIFFACANEDGKLVRENTLPFLANYMHARKVTAEEKGTLPLTREEVMALPKLLCEASKGRELALAVMFRNKPQKEYARFCRRVNGLREQMQDYMDKQGNVTEEGARRFTKEFFGCRLERFPSLASLRHPSAVAITTATTSWMDAIVHNTSQSTVLSPSSTATWQERIKGNDNSKTDPPPCIRSKQTTAPWRPSPEGEAPRR